MYPPPPRTSAVTPTTVLLAAASRGDDGAQGRLFAHVYDELRRLSQGRLGPELSGATVSATELVHEAYLKMVGSESEWRDRGHFFCAAARAMRHILVDRARARQSEKRGGGVQAQTLRPDLDAPADAALHVLDIHDALDRLGARDAGLARVVELRFFGGLDMDEVAEALGISPRTAARRWAQAKAHLRADLS